MLKRGRPFLSYWPGLAPLLLGGCSVVFNQPSPAGGNSARGLSVANPEAFYDTGAELSVSTDRVVHVRNVPAGRIYQLALREEGGEVGALSCAEGPEEWQDGTFRTVGFVRGNTLFFEPPARNSDTVAVWKCTSAGVPFEVQWHLTRSELSVLSSTMQLSTDGDHEAGEPAISYDGTVLAWNRKAGPGMIVARDRQSARTWLVSKDRDGRPARLYTAPARISGNGRYAVFVSDAPNIAAGTPANISQVYRLDLATPGALPLIVSSLNSAAPSQSGNAGDAASSEPDISHDGRYVVFTSSASNLGAGVGGIRQIYLKDLATPAAVPLLVSSLDSEQANQTTYRGNSDSSQSAIAASGDFAVFESTATRFGPAGQVYRKDLRHPSTPPLIVSSTDSTRANQTGYAGGGSAPDISADGRFVVFPSTATLLSANNSSGYQVYLKDMNAQGTPLTVVSSLNSTAPDQTALVANAYAYKTQISDDGNVVAFTTNATNLGVSGYLSQVYYKRRSEFSLPPRIASSADTLRADQTAVAADANVLDFALSGDGNHIAFISLANNLGLVHRLALPFVKDLREPQTPPVVVSYSPEQRSGGHATALATASRPRFSRDGRYAVFLASHSRFTGVGLPYSSQVYRKNLFDPTAPVTLVSSLDSTQPDQTAYAATAFANEAAISADGRFVVFTANSLSFAGGATQQVYVKDLDYPHLPPTLVSSLDSTAADQSALKANAPAFGPAISGNGRYVAFHTSATNFVAGTPATQVYLKDLENPGLPPIIVSSRDSNQSNQAGYAASGAAMYPSLSYDGRYVAFEATALNFSNSGGGPQIFRKDMADNTTRATVPVLVSSTDSSQSDQYFYRGLGSSTAAQISEDARFVVFTSTATNFATGTSGTQIYRKDLSAPATSPLIVSSKDATVASQSTVRGDLPSDQPQISGDGRYLVFRTRAANFEPTPVGALYQVYWKDMDAPAAPPQLLSTVRLGSTTSLTDAGNGPTGAPTLSGDGSYVAFESNTTNLIPGAAAPLVLRDIRPLRP